MEKVPAVSIIVPVYKAEKYIHRCVDSLLAQTFADFEVILVDDGSPDNSGKICDEYASIDSRVKVFHKENGGVSSARQYGLDNATGEYVIHADPDDWVEQDMLGSLYNCAVSQNADMVICDFFVNQGEQQIYRKQQPSMLEHNTVLRELFQQLHGSCWNKLVRRVCFSNFNVRFPKNFSFCEDLYVNASLLVHDITVSYLPKAFYHYVLGVNDNSIVGKYNLRIQQEDFSLFSSINELLKNNASICYVARCRIAYTITFRAFSASIESACSFYKKFHKFAFYVIRNKNESLFVKILLFLSCIGLYPFARKIYIIRAVYPNKFKR